MQCSVPKGIIVEEMKLTEAGVLTHLVCPETGFNRILDGGKQHGFEGWTVIAQQTLS